MRSSQFQNEVDDTADFLSEFEEDPDDVVFEVD